MIAERRLSGIFGYILGSGFAVQVLMVISTVVLSRLYGPEPFGALAFYAGIASVYSVISGLRFDYLAFGRSRNLAFSYYLIALSVSLLLLPIIVLAALGMMSLLKNEVSLLMVTLFCFSSSLFYLGTQYLVALGGYKKFAIFRVWQVFAQFVIGFAGYVYFSNIGLLYAFMLSQFLVGFCIFFSCYSSLNSSIFIGAYKIFYNYKRKASVHSLLVAIQYSTPFAPVLIGGIYFSAAELGGYFVMAQFFSGPFSVFRRSTINFLNGEMGDKNLAVALLLKYKNNFALGMVGVLILVSAGLFFLFFAKELLVSVVFGDQWAEFAAMLLPIFAYFLLDAILQPITTLLPLWGYERRAIWYEVLRFFLVFFILPLLVYLFDFSFYNFIVVYFSGMLLCYFLIAMDVYKKISEARRCE